MLCLWSVVFVMCVGGVWCDVCVLCACGACGCGVWCDVYMWCMCVVFVVHVCVVCGVCGACGV